MLGEITERDFDATFDLNRGSLACRYRDDLLDGRVERPSNWRGGGSTWLSVVRLDPWQPQDPQWRNIGGTVATLNIKNLPDGLYKKLQARAKRDRRSVAQEVTHLLSEALEASKPLSILELQGLGKEHWQGIDAAAHVQRERASWD